MALSIGNKILGGFGLAVAVFGVSIGYGLVQLKPGEQDSVQSILVVSVIAGVIAMVIGIKLSQHINRRLRVIHNALRAFGAGELNHSIAKDSDDELGQLMDLLNAAMVTQRKVTDSISQIANGDLGRTLGVKSELDIVSSSLNQLVNTLNDTAQQATFIASGNYQVDIQPRSQNDSLGIALQNMTKTLHDASLVIAAIAEGDFTLAVEIKGEQDVLARSINRMVSKLRETSAAIEAKGWINEGNTQLVKRIQGELTTKAIATAVLDQICNHTTAYIGTFYLYDQHQQRFSLLHSHAVTDCAKTFAKGEGIIGQVTLSRKVLMIDQLPEKYLTVNTSLGQASPSHLIVVPLVFNDQVSGVMELAGLHEFTPETLTLLEQQAISIAAAIQVSQARETTAILLKETQAQAEKLQQQQQKLQASNETLEAQTLQLKQSEQALKQQSNALKVSNEELEDKQASLANSKNEIEIKAEELAVASKYKSEFLANMSHELRTPLNSLLILSRALADNKQGNLTPDQVEEATIVHQGGQSLLLLINDIMDLSKVEAGMLDIYPEQVSLRGAWLVLDTLFAPVAAQKGLVFTHSVEDCLPQSLQTDAQRLQQILKNLLSNAFKFTSQGAVTLRIHAPVADCHFRCAHLTVNTAIAFTVADTGIGIPLSKLKAIFEAFQQADGSTSRQYGGTGLGLTISRELASLLGGEIQLTSEEHHGSTFTLYLPLKWQGNVAVPQRKISHHNLPIETALPEKIPVITSNKAPTSGEHVVEPQITYWMVDDRRHVRASDKTVLIIEDDHASASLLVKLCHQLDFKVLVTNKGREGIMLSIEYSPNCILLDMGLPDVTGHQVLTQLKDSLHTRHIPVHVITAAMQAFEALNLGALSYFMKPVNNASIVAMLKGVKYHNPNQPKHLLVVQGDYLNLEAIEDSLNEENVELVVAETVKEACVRLAAQVFDCIVLSLNLSDSNDNAQIKSIRTQANASKTPIVIYTGQPITPAEHQVLDQLRSEMVIKGAQSPQRLIDEVSLFLHLPDDGLSGEQRQALQLIHNEDDTTKGSRILLVDDDMRNMFALTRTLENEGFYITQAEHGEAAINVLKENDQPFDMILMDIMMPTMDGYEAIGLIRQMPAHQLTPIIALTAKAMPTDRNKCIEVGASEYLTKPLDMDKLLLMLRVWLYKQVKS